MDWVDSVSFLLGSALSFTACARWARRTTSANEEEVAVLTVLSWIGLVILSALALSTIGRLHVLTLHATVAVVAASALVWMRRSPTPTRAPARASQPPSMMQSVLGALGLLGVGVQLASEVWTGIHRAPWDGDSLLYHLPILHERLMSGSYWGLEAPFSHYPSYAGFLGSWFFSLPWHDALLNLQNVAAYALFVCGVALLIRRLGGGSGTAWLGAAIFVLNARMVARQVTTQESDLLLAALLLVAWTWSLDSQPRRVQRWFMALALGFAMGCKYSGLPLVVWIALQAIVRRTSRVSLGAALREWAGPVGLVVLLGSLPYLRNWWLAGTPIFPKEVATLGWTAAHGVDPTQIFGSRGESMNLLEVLPRGLAVWRAWFLGVVDHLGWWPWWGVLFVLVRLVSRRPTVGQWEGLGLWAVTLSLMVVTPAFPRWEDAPVPQWLAQGYSPARFALLPMAVAAAFAGVGLEVVVGRWAPRWSTRRIGGSTMIHALRRRTEVLGALLITAFLAGAVWWPAARSARADSRAAEFAAYQPDAADLLQWSDAHLSRECVLVVGGRTRPWFFVGRDYDNRLRRPGSSAWPIFDEPGREPTTMILAPGPGADRWRDEWKRRHPVSRPLVFGRGYEVWRVAR